MSTAGDALRVGGKLLGMITCSLVQVGKDSNIWPELTLSKGSTVEVKYKASQMLSHISTRCG